MKIVRIIARLNVGGPARHVVWLTKELDGGEFRSVLVAGTVPEGEQSMEYFAEEHGVEPIFIREMSRELSLKDVVSMWKVFKLLRRERPDIIHTHTAKAGTVGRISGLFYKIFFNRRVKTVHTYHGHVFHSYYGSLKTRLFLAIEKVLGAVATDSIIAITEQQKEEIHKTFGVGREDKFSVIPLGIDLEKFDMSPDARARFRAEVGASDDEMLVGFVGRLTEIKNIPMLIDAAANLLAMRSASEKVRFVIIGDGNLRTELEDYAVTRRVASRLLFVGNRNDAPVFYAGLDVVALTSLNEGTPLSLIEAMAARRPVIATAVGGVIDLVGAQVEAGEGFKVHERGLTVGSGDAEGFARGLARLAEDPALRETLASTAFVFVRARYGKDRLVSDIAALYRRLHGARS